MAVDLVAKLTEAASAAIANVRPDLERDPKTIRSLVLELAVTGRGDVAECEAYTMRHLRVRDALGLGKGER